MIFSRHRVPPQDSNPLCGRFAPGAGFILAAIMLVGGSDGIAEQPKDMSLDDRRVAHGDDVETRKKRATRRRPSRSSSGDAERIDRRRERLQQTRMGRRARKVKERDDKRVHLRVSGSYELDLGNDRVVRGEGSTTIDLDRGDVDRLRTHIGKTIHGPAGKEFFKAVSAMPATLKSMNELLKTLSDPQTQEALRQAEQLLHLLPKSPQGDSRESAKR